MLFCFTCGDNIESPKKGFAGFTGGAVQEEGANLGSSTGFLDIFWKSSLEQGGGLINFPFFSDEDGKDGQFECYFCSMNCLRAFVDSKLDGLQKKIEDSFSETDC